MIYTGDWPLSAQALEALRVASVQAAQRQPPIATCEDLLRAVVSIPGAEARQVWRAFGRPGATNSMQPSGDARGGPAPAVPPELLAQVRANKPLQEAIELSAHGAGITTGTLLLALVQVERSEASVDLLARGITEDRIRDCLLGCEPERIGPDLHPRGK